MAQFSAAITACSSESKFAKAYREGLHRSKYWEVKDRRDYLWRLRVRRFSHVCVKLLSIMIVIAQFRFENWIQCMTGWLTRWIELDSPSIRILMRGKSCCNDGAKCDKMEYFLKWHRLFWYLVCNQLEYQFWRHASQNCADKLVKLFYPCTQWQTIACV